MPAVASSRFRWAKAKSEAAVLLAEDELTAPAVAEKLGISYRQLKRWRESPVFRARVEAIAQDLGEVARRYAITNLNARMKALDDRWHALRRIVDERAVAPEMQQEPGGNTGLLVRRVRMIGSGENAARIEEFAVDVGLLRELLRLERQAAQECGQWNQKVAPTAPDGEEPWAGGYTDEEVREILRRLAIRLGLPGLDEPGEEGVAANGS